MKFFDFYNVVEETKESSLQLLMKHYPNNQKVRDLIFGMDQTPSKGDVPTLIKFFDQSNGLGSLVKKYVDKYYILRKKNKIQGITLFRDYLKFTEKIDALDKIINITSGERGNVEIDGNDVLVDNEDIQIIKGDSQDKCIKYGQGYSFCISRQYGGNMYNNYRLRQQSSFYFIFFKKTSKSDPKHIMILDSNDRGMEWTFADNNTRPTTWKEIVSSFPILQDYKALFMTDELSEDEKHKIKTFENMLYLSISDRVEAFKEMSYNLKSDYLKTEPDLPDIMFDLLDKNLRNDFISIGPNLTIKQARSLGASERSRYLQTRQISVKQLIDNRLYTFNELDENIPLIREKIKSDYEEVLKMVKEAEENSSEILAIEYYYFLRELPDMSHLKIRDLKISNNILKSLKGLPEEVTGHLMIADENYIETLEGCPKKSKDFTIQSCSELKDLTYSPEVTQGFTIYNCFFNTLKGCPKKVPGTFELDGYYESMEGGPLYVGNYDGPNAQFKSFKGHPLYVENRMKFIGFAIQEIDSIPYFELFEDSNFSGINNKAVFNFLKDVCYGIPHRFLENRAKELLEDAHKTWLEKKSQLNEQRKTFSNNYKLILEQIKSSHRLP